MNHSNCKYSCLIKGDWYKRFVELIEMFQISLHKKFIVSMPSFKDREYNLIVVHGISLPELFPLPEVLETAEESFALSERNQVRTEVCNYHDLAVQSVRSNLFENRFSCN